MATRGKSRKVHVTYDDSKRIITYSKGEEVQKLRHHFLRAFSDVLSDDVAPANVKFHRFDDSFQDYEDIAHDVQLEDNVKLKAIVTQKRGKKVSAGCCATDETEAECLHFCHHVTIPDSCLFSPHQKPHPIKKDVTYKLWNLVANGLIGTDPNDPRRVLVSAGFSADDVSMTLVNAKNIGTSFNLVFYEGGRDSGVYITAQQQGNGITTTTNPTDLAQFQPVYFWSFTLFRCKAKSTVDVGMYLGVDESTTLATLIPIDDDPVVAQYPDPRALFIAMKPATAPPPSNK